MGSGVVKLNTNENPYPPPAAVMRAIAGVAGEALRLYPDPTAAAFREVAARRHGVRPEQVIAGNGSDDILTILLRTFVPAGGRVAYPTPTYSLYKTLAQIQGAAVAEVPWRASWGLPADDLAATDASLTFVVNPNAPSGTIVERRELAALADRLPGVLVVDEAYADFADGDAMPLVDRHPNVVVTRSLSKGYSLAGLRFGYAVAGEAVVEQMMKVKDSYNVDALAQAAATAALVHAADAEQTWRDVRRDRQTLADGLARLGFDVTPSHANFLLVKPPADAATLYRQLKSRGLLVRHFATPGLSDLLRITVGTPEQVARLLSTLAELLPETQAA